MEQSRGRAEPRASGTKGQGAGKDFGAQSGPGNTRLPLAGAWCLGRGHPLLGSESGESPEQGRDVTQTPGSQGPWAAS